MNLKRIHYNDNIYVCSRHLKVINDDMVRNSSVIQLLEYYNMKCNI